MVCGNFFHIFQITIFCFLITILDLVHDVEAIAYVNC